MRPISIKSKCMEIILNYLGSMRYLVHLTRRSLNTSFACNHIRSSVLCHKVVSSCFYSRIQRNMHLKPKAGSWVHNVTKLPYIKFNRIEPCWEQCFHNHLSWCFHFLFSKRKYVHDFDLIAYLSFSPLNKHQKQNYCGFYLFVANLIKKFKWTNILRKTILFDKKPICGRFLDMTFDASMICFQSKPSFPQKNI